MHHGCLMFVFGHSAATFCLSDQLSGCSFQVPAWPSLLGVSSTFLMHRVPCIHTLSQEERSRVSRQHTTRSVCSTSNTNDKQHTPRTEIQVWLWALNLPFGSALPLPSSSLPPSSLCLSAPLSTLSGLLLEAMGTLLVFNRVPFVLWSVQPLA